MGKDITIFVHITVMCILEDDPRSTNVGSELIEMASTSSLKYRGRVSDTLARNFILCGLENCIDTFSKVDPK